MSFFFANPEPMNAKPYPFSRLLLLFAMVCGSPPAQAKDDPALEEYFIASAAYNRKLYPVAVAQFESFLRKNGNHYKADLSLIHI